VGRGKTEVRDEGTPVFTRGFIVKGLPTCLPNLGPMAESERRKKSGSIRKNTGRPFFYGFRQFEEPSVLEYSQKGESRGGNDISVVERREEREASGWTAKRGGKIEGEKKLVLRINRVAF